MKQGRYGWLVGALLLPLCGQAQYPGWQQQADYTMEIDLDVATRQFAGSSEIRYTNASPDALNRLYIHLFFNALAAWRVAVGGGEAIIPSTAKVASAGVRIDVPLGHKDNV